MFSEAQVTLIVTAIVKQAVGEITDALAQAVLDDLELTDEQKRKLLDRMLMYVHCL